MREHHRGIGGVRGGRLRAAVFGINDGLVSNASLVIGVAAANPPQNVVVLAGLAGLVAGAFSMAAGEYISVRVQREMYEALIESERREIDEDPEHELFEASVILQARGVPPKFADEVAAHVMADREAALDMMTRDELGLNPDDLGSPWGAAASSFGAFAIGAALPVLPYLFLASPVAFWVALTLAGIALAAVGALSSWLTDLPPWRGALRMVVIGALAVGVTYVIGRLLGVSGLF
jgi:VIT1/CCC1 family predicted Fe2+/Mn2+ transporter